MRSEGSAGLGVSEHETHRQPRVPVPNRPHDSPVDRALIALMVWIGRATGSRAWGLRPTKAHSLGSWAWDRNAW